MEWKRSKEKRIRTEQNRRKATASWELRSTEYEYCKPKPRLLIGWRDSAGLLTLLG